MEAFLLNLAQKALECASKALPHTPLPEWLRVAAGNADIRWGDVLVRVNCLGVTAADLIYGRSPSGTLTILIRGLEFSQDEIAATRPDIIDGLKEASERFRKEIDEVEALVKAARQEWLLSANV